MVLGGTTSFLAHETLGSVRISMEKVSPCEDFRQFCVQLQVTLRLSMSMFTGHGIRNTKGRREDTIAGGLRDHLEQVPSLAGGATDPGKGPDVP